MGHVDRHRHQGFGLVAGKAKHHSLVTRANVFDILIRHFAAFVFHGMIDAQGNIRALAGNRGKNGTGVAIEAFGAVVIADFFDHFANQFVKIDKGIGRDFTQNHHHPGFGSRFTGHT